MEKPEEAKKGLWSSVPSARLGTAIGIGATSIVGAPVTLVPPPGKPAADDTRFTTYKLTLHKVFCFEAGPLLIAGPATDGWPWWRQHDCSEPAAERSG